MRERIPPDHSRWERIEALAWWRLNHAASLDPPIPSERPRLRLWDDAGGFVYPTEPFTLTVFSSNLDAETDSIVREAKWKCTSDLATVRTVEEKEADIIPFEPTITVRDARVDAVGLSALLRAGTGLHLPLVSPSDLIGITSDVGAVGCEIFSEDQPPAVLRLQWSDSTPDEWKPVVEWVRRLREFFEQCLGNDK